MNIDVGAYLASLDAILQKTMKRFFIWIKRPADPCLE